MAAIIKLAWLEFILPFKRPKSGVPGGRDFLWLTLMLTLVITLALLLLATRTGLVNKFIDVFLGNTKEKGVPVWVIPNPFNKSGIDFINKDIMSDIQARGYAIYPYREIEPGLDYINLPQKKIWKAKSKLEPQFSGWAVYADDPLHQTGKPPDGLPLEITLSKTLFREFFNFEAYRDALSEKIPRSVLDKIPQNFSDQNLIETLWLDVRIGDKVHLLPFKVKWLNRIPTISKVSFLFPMTTYHAIREAQNYPQLRYFPEHYGESGKRIKRVLIPSPFDQAALEKISKSTRSVIGTTRGRTTLTFSRPMPEISVKGLLDDAGLKFRVIESAIGHRVEGSKYSVNIPCGVVPTRELEDLSKLDADGDNCNAEINVTASGNGFLRALVYVRDRTRISEAAKELLTLRRQALSIHPVYQDALNRFGFLTKILHTLRAPFGTILIAFVIAILAIQISTLVDHRKIRYAIFMTKGLSWHHIYSIVFFQMLFSVAVASAASTIAIKILTDVVASRVQLVAVEFSHFLDLQEFNLLPLEAGDYAGVVCSILILALVFSSAILYTTPIRRQTHLAPLLRG